MPKDDVPVAETDRPAANNSLADGTPQVRHEDVPNPTLRAQLPKPKAPKRR